MKKLCAVLLLAGATAAFAAEECKEGHFRWDLGGQAGVAVGSARIRTFAADDTSLATVLSDQNLGETSFRGGAYLGIGYEFANKWMLGLQAAVDGDTFKRANHLYNVSAAVNTVVFTDDVKFQIKAPIHYAVDARIGRHIHGVLCYALVGFEGTSAKYFLQNDSGTSTGGAASVAQPVMQIPSTGYTTELTQVGDSFQFAGVRAGLGMECELSEHWMMRLEGRYLWQANKVLDVANAAGTVQYKHKLGFQQAIAQLSIGYKF